MEKLQTEELKRELGIFDVAINVVNISISSGIFILPALIAAILRGASIMAYILCGLMLLLIAQWHTLVWCGCIGCCSNLKWYC